MEFENQAIKVSIAYTYHKVSGTERLFTGSWLATNSYLNTRHTHPRRRAFTHSLARCLALSHNIYGPMLHAREPANVKQRFHANGNSYADSSFAFVIGLLLEYFTKQFPTG